MKGVTMAQPPPDNLNAALSGALGAITNTRAAVKAAAAQVYNPPADQVPAPAGQTGAVAARS